MTHNYSSQISSVDVYNLDHSQADRYNLTTFELNGYYYLIAHSPKCLILSNPNMTSNMFSLWNYDSVGGSYTQDAVNLQTLMSINESYSNTSLPWLINDNCDKIKFNNNFVFKNNGGTWAVMTNPVNFTVEAQDKNLDYAIANGNLYKYDANSNGFVLHHTPSSPFVIGNATHTASIHSYMDRLILNGTSNNTASVWCVAYLVESNGTLT